MCIYYSAVMMVTLLQVDRGDEFPSLRILWEELGK